MEGLNQLTDKIIGCAIEVHKQLGPGLLEVVYERALSIELNSVDIEYEQQIEIDVYYKGSLIGKQRLDFVIEDAVVVELKAVNSLDPLHQAQLLGYLKLAGYPLGLLINFNTKLLKQGIKRMVI